MGRSVRNAAVVERVKVASSARIPIDYDRYISQRGLEHLTNKLPGLQFKIDEVKMTIADFAREREDVSRYEELRRLARLEEEVDNIKRVLGSPIVIDDCAEYQELPEGEIWFGCGVSYIDGFGPAYIALLNNLEREIPHHHQPVNTHAGQAVFCGCKANVPQALIGHRVGDEVEYEIDGQIHKLEILAVSRLLGC